MERIFVRSFHVTVFALDAVPPFVLDMAPRQTKLVCKGDGDAGGGCSCGGGIAVADVGWFGWFVVV